MRCRASVKNNVMNLPQKLETVASPVSLLLYDYSEHRDYDGVFSEEVQSIIQMLCSQPLGSRATSVERCCTGTLLAAFSAAAARMTRPAMRRTGASPGTQTQGTSPGVLYELVS